MFHVEHQITRTPLSKQKAEETRELFEAHRRLLEEYIDHLSWWNQKINLVSRSVSRETLRQHVEHSLIIARCGMFSKAKVIIDSGTGGGLPGIPLAIVSTKKKVYLNDLVSKKIMVCKHIAKDLGLKNIEMVPGSVKNIFIDSGGVVVSKHAFKINDLYNMIKKKPWNGLILLKGEKETEVELKGIEDEIQVKITSLGAGFDDDFYTGKAIVEIIRTENE